MLVLLYPGRALEATPVSSVHVFGHLSLGPRGTETLPTTLRLGAESSLVPPSQGPGLSEGPGQPAEPCGFLAHKTGEIRNWGCFGPLRLSSLLCAGDEHHHCEISSLLTVTQPQQLLVTEVSLSWTALACHSPGQEKRCPPVCFHCGVPGRERGRAGHHRAPRGFSWRLDTCRKGCPTRGGERIFQGL